MNQLGALDTKTSTQVMEILKKISDNKLIIMVTHNSEIAEKYSSRIIKVLDGKVIDDSNPVEKEKKNKKKDRSIEEPEKAKFRRTSMKFGTAFRLSLNNLMTKKGRTILTSFAGSIGIIGIALILAISTGVQDYIDRVEEDTLSSYPITIEKSTVDMSSMILNLMGEKEVDTSNREDGKVYSLNIMDDMMTNMSSQVKNNNLTKFKNYIENESSVIKENSTSVEYKYDMNLNLYRVDSEDSVLRVNPNTVMNSIGMGNMMEAQSSTIASMGGSSSMTMMSQTSVFTRMLDNKELLKSQYDVVKGRWPENYNEVVLIVTENNELSDYTLYALGLKDQKVLEDRMKRMQKGEVLEETEEVSYSFDELLDLKYKVLLNSDYYDKVNNVWLDKSEDEEFVKSKLMEAEEITVVGIIKQNDQSVATSMMGGIGYLKDLEEHVIEKSNEALVVKEQKENENINIFTGLEFPDDNDYKFDLNSLSIEQQMMLASLSAQQISEMMKAYSENKDASLEKNLVKLGAINLNEPSSISIYPKNFDSKEIISAEIEKYNTLQTESNEEENKITYTDIIGTMMKSVSNIINTISYVLIAFVAISLIVSSIMIGIITYISVLERVKEIGILRSIGASKRDISTVFNAETLIVGLISGLIGIAVTVILTLPINSLILAITGVKVVTKVPFIAGVILVGISVLLTVVAGLVPAKMASKKDPVIALRTE